MNGKPYQSSMRTMGVTLSALPMYCARCRHNWVKIQRGALIRRANRLCLIHDEGITRWRAPNCPECGGKAIFLTSCI